MIIFPAIDLLGGEAVRLYKGDFAKKTVYSSDPVGVAKTFLAKGATHVHLVDLDGALTGEMQNFGVMCAIKKETGLFVEAGGGIRTLAAVERYLNAGVDRVILGTAAVTDPAFVPSLPAVFLPHVAVGADVKDGRVAIRGWTEQSGYTMSEFCKKMQDAGVGTIVCTDVSKDGAMRGANHALYEELSQKTDMQIIASGGVCSLGDVKKLKARGLYGAIVGKAYYEGALDLTAAIEVAK